MPAKKIIKTSTTSTHSHDDLEAQVKSLSADVASLNLSVENLERSIAALTKIDEDAYTPPVPQGIEVRFNKLVEVLAGKFGGIKDI